MDSYNMYPTKVVYSLKTLISLLNSIIKKHIFTKPTLTHTSTKNLKIWITISKPSSLQTNDG